MRYMMFIKHTEDYEPGDVPASLYQAMGAFIEEATRNGHFIDGAGLQPMAAGARIRLQKGTISVIDGPFAEAKEVVGGYAIIDAASHDEALQFARRFMELHRTHWPAFEGECEVRPFEAMRSATEPG